MHPKICAERIRIESSLMNEENESYALEN